MQKMKWFLFLYLLPVMMSFSLVASTAKVDAPVAVHYFTLPFGNLHQNASLYSTSLTTLSCNHPIKVFSQTMGNWVRVQVANQVGYLSAESLSPKQVRCFQDLYPRFFDQFELTPTELYYWGRLYDLYLSGKSRVR